MFYEIYRYKHEGELPCIKHKDFSCYNYVFYITTTPYLPCNKITRKDFYYTLVTLITGYKYIYDIQRPVVMEYIICTLIIKIKFTSKFVHNRIYSIKQRLD